MDLDEQRDMAWYEDNNWVPIIAPIIAWAIDDMLKFEEERLTEDLLEDIKLVASENDLFLSEHELEYSQPRWDRKLAKAMLTALQDFIDYEIVINDAVEALLCKYNDAVLSYYNNYSGKTIDGQVVSLISNYNNVAPFELSDGEVRVYMHPEVLGFLVSSVQSACTEEQREALQEDCERDFKFSSGYIPHHTLGDDFPEKWQDWVYPNDFKSVFQYKLILEHSDTAVLMDYNEVMEVIFEILSNGVHEAVALAAEKLILEQNFSEEDYDDEI